MQKLLIEDDEGRALRSADPRRSRSAGREAHHPSERAERLAHHARLVGRQGSLLLRGLSSYNGNKLNGAAVRGLPRSRRDIILIGDIGWPSKRTDPAQAMAVPAARSPCGGHTPAAGWGRRAASAEGARRLEAQPTIPLHSLATEATLPESLLRRRVSSSLADS